MINSNEEEFEPECNYQPSRCSNCGEIVLPWLNKSKAYSIDGKKYSGVWFPPPELCRICFIEKIARKCIKNSGFKKLHQKMDFDSFIAPNNQIKKIVDELKEYNFPKLEDAQNIYLYGFVGVGKTHLVVSLAKQIVYKTGLSLKFTTGIKLLNLIRSTYSPDNNSNAYDIINMYSQVPLLVIDDLGAEKPSGWVREIFYQIIDARNSEQFPTFVTTNLKPKVLAERLDDRIVSRLVENAIVRKLEGEDYRLKSIRG